jgi:hypothetical protein
MLGLPAKDCNPPKGLDHLSEWFALSIKKLASVIEPVTQARDK